MSSDNKKVDSLELIRRKVMKEPTIQHSRIYYTLSPLGIPVRCPECLTAKCSLQF